MAFSLPFPLPPAPPLPALFLPGRSRGLVVLIDLPPQLIIAFVVILLLSGLVCRLSDQLEAEGTDILQQGNCFVSSAVLELKDYFGVFSLHHHVSLDGVEVSPVFFHEGWLVHFLIMGATHCPFLSHATLYRNASAKTWKIYYRT